MLVRVLGSAAGGGFPQWNCGCPNCRGVRRGTIRASPRLQDSLAVSADGEEWILCNASPDIRTQIESFPALEPRGRRGTPIEGIVLSSGDLDHVLGLFALEESQPVVIHATERVRAGLVEQNAIYRTLERFPGQVTWRPLEFGRATPLATAAGKPGGLSIEAFPVAGNPPLHLLGQLEPSPQDAVGVRILDQRTGRSLAYVPCAAGAPADLLRRLDAADALFFDGTFWSSDELQSAGGGSRSAEDMGHWPISGAKGSLLALAGLKVPRRIYTHLNNTNPLLREDSAERREVERAGWETAFDGMELEL